MRQGSSDWQAIAEEEAETIEKQGMLIRKLVELLRVHDAALAEEINIESREASEYE